MSDNFDDEDFDEDEMVEIFNKAAQYIEQTHSELSSSDLLELYAFYKQSTCGSCNIPKPGIFNTQARSKWISWNNLKNLNKREAMKSYIKKVTELNPSWKDKMKEKSFWVSVSRQLPEAESEINESDKTAFEYTKDNNLAKLKESLKHDKINELDDSGIGLIHWAADRNVTEILEYLLKNGAEVNLQDNEGQTALHYASSCGNVECIKILLQFNADKSIMDSDGQTCIQVAYDSNVRELLKN